jgi:hypothetical protein
MVGKRLRGFAMIAFVLAAACGRAGAAVVNVDPAAAWQGFMNVYSLPTSGGGYDFGSAWGPADLRATFSGPVLTLAPNTIADAASYWYTPSGGPDSVGNKIMDANFYVETTGTYSGQTLTFTGLVLGNTMTGKADPNGNGWTTVAVIKDFAPDYSSFTSRAVQLTPGVFSVTLDLVNDPARHVQYGFEVVGPDVWAADPDLPGYGNVQITAVPEAGVLGAVALAGVALLGRRRK